jgi:hypothetical protein
VTIADLDIVEPFYTLRPLKRLLEDKGITVVGWGRDEAFGLGEAGTFMKPEARWVLRRPGHVILDIGYGIQGAMTLNLVEGAETSEELKVLAVINACRPMTAEVDDIAQYVTDMGHVNALVNNTHLGDDTTLEVVFEGLEKVRKAADLLGLPIEYTAMDERFREIIGGDVWEGQAIRYLKRFMPGAMW